MVRYLKGIDWLWRGGGLGFLAMLGCAFKPSKNIVAGEESLYNFRMLPRLCEYLKNLVGVENVGRPA